MTPTLVVLGYILVITAVATATNVWFSTRSGWRNIDSDTAMAVLVGIFWPISVPMIALGCLVVLLTSAISLVTNWLVKKWKL